MKDLGVLVVHDDDEGLSVIERLFSYLKIRVDCVGSTTEALDHLKAKNYRTLVTDMDMPGMMNGMELTLRARGLFPKLKVILFSGHSTEQLINLIIDPILGNRQVATFFNFVVTEPITIPTGL